MGIAEILADMARNAAQIISKVFQMRHQRGANETRDTKDADEPGAWPHGSYNLEINVVPARVNLAAWSWRIQPE
jgi:hypothetical protein